MPPHGRDLDADPWRALFRTLPGEIALCEERGLPVVFRSEGEPAEHVRKLMGALGVRIEVVPVSRSTGRSTFAPQGDARNGMVAQDYRASVARVFIREQNGDEALTCPSCGIETDVTNVVHSPQCPVVTGKTNGRSTGRAALDAMDAGQPQPVDTQPDISAAEIAANGSAEPQKEDTNMDTGRKVWTRDEILDAIKTWASTHAGAPPSSSDWMKAQDGFPTTSTVIKYCGKWSTAITDAGFAKPKRGGQGGNKNRGTGRSTSKPRPAKVAAAKVREAPPVSLNGDVSLAELLAAFGQAQQDSEAAGARMLTLSAQIKQHPLYENLRNWI